MLGLTKKAFEYSCSETIKLFYCKTSSRLRCQCMSSKKNIKELERLERIATKLIAEVRDLDDQQRLSKLDLTNLSTRFTCTN